MVKYSIKIFPVVKNMDYMLSKSYDWEEGHCLKPKRTNCRSGFPVILKTRSVLIKLKKPYVIICGRLMVNGN